LAKEEGKTISLQTEELQLISLLDGSKSVRDVVRESGAEEFDVYKTLYAMATSRVIQATDGPARPRGMAEGDELATLLQVYHDVVVTISKHLEEQLGKEFRARLFTTCEASLPPAGQQILAGYKVSKSADQNVRETFAAAATSQQGEAAVALAGAAFNQFISLLLQGEAEILGNKQTRHTVGRIHQLLEVVEKYRTGEAKSRLIQGIRDAIAQVVAGLDK
jgi:hypothetical protein